MPDNYALEKSLGQLLVEFNLTIALAESCTGGLIMQKLSDVPGCSRYLLGGVVAYSNQVKNDVLRVPVDIIEKYGAVSDQTARFMAAGIRQLTGAAIGFGITGIAGPGGGTAEKPVGTVYAALAEEKEIQCRLFLFSGTRVTIRQNAAQASLKMIYDYLQGYIDNQG